MNKKPRILITNDDGIHAPGIQTLWEGLSDFAETIIIAPSLEQSGVGVGITIRNPIHIESVRWEKNTSAWKINGTPADCIRFGLSVILDEPPDLIVSGINRGANSGRNVLYSGTIGGVIEGTLKGIPGIAFSCVDFRNPDYEATKPHLLPIVKHVLDHSLPKGTLLNVNFPEGEIRGIQLAKQGRGYWVENPQEGKHPEGHSYYWMGGQWKDMDEPHEGDVALLKAGYVAVVPIHVDEMTDHQFFSARKHHFDQFCDAHHSILKK